MFKEGQVILDNSNWKEQIQGLLGTQDLTEARRVDIGLVALAGKAKGMEADDVAGTANRCGKMSQGSKTVLLWLCFFLLLLFFVFLGVCSFTEEKNNFYSILFFYFFWFKQNSSVHVKGPAAHGRILALDSSDWVKVLLCFH